MEFAVRFVSSHLSPAPSHRAATLGALSTTSSFTLQLWTCWDLVASLAPPPSALLSGTKLWLIYIKYDSWKTCCFAACLYKCPHHHSWFQLLLPESPSRWDPLSMTPNTTYNIFFFFQNPLIHKHWRAFFLSHTNKHDHVLFIVHAFLSFLFFMYTQMLQATAETWDILNTVQPLSSTQKKWKAGKKEREWLRKRPDEVLLCWKWRPYFLFFWNNTMHAHTLRVPSHRQPDYIAQDFLSSTCSVLD